MPPRGKAAAATDDKSARSWAKYVQRRTTTSYRLTLELSGGAAVRLNEMLDGCDAACSGDNDLPGERTA
jgi:hypothetical protein